MPVLVVDKSGARAGSLGDNKRDLDERQRGAFGADLALSPQTPQSMWSGIGAQRDTELGEAGVRAAIYGSSVDHAPGTFLDALGSNLGIERRIATSSRVTATLTGVAGTGVPTGSRARTDPAGDEFRTLADAVLSPSGVTVEMEAVESGPVAALAGTLTKIVTVIAGWETITNTGHAAQGVARESDDNYRRTLFARTARVSMGPLPALVSSLEEALAKKTRVAENSTSANVVVQEWTLLPHSILVVAESGSDGDARRAVENHRGMGVATNTAIVGGAPFDGALDTISAGVVEWNGSSYTGLDLTAQTSIVVSFSGGSGTGVSARAIVENGVITRIEVVGPGSGYTSPPAVTITAGTGAGAAATATIDAGGMVDGITVTNGGANYLTDDQRNMARAAALTTLLDGDVTPPIVAYSSDRFIAQFPWSALATPRFANNATSAAFGLDPDVAAYPAGPFVRPTERRLACSFTMTRGTGFPSDGLDSARRAVLARVTEYGIGAELWLPDLSCEAEAVPGTRISNFSVTDAAGEAVSGLPVPIDNLWSLSLADLSITVV